MNGNPLHARRRETEGADLLLSESIEMKGPDSSQRCSLQQGKLQLDVVHNESEDILGWGLRELERCEDILLEVLKIHVVQAPINLLCCKIRGG